MKDYTKELGHPDSWTDEEKEELVSTFRKAFAAMAQKGVRINTPSDREILKIAAEHWKFQNGEELEDAVTLEELEETIKRSRQNTRRTRKPGIKPTP